MGDLNTLLLGVEYKLKKLLEEYEKSVKENQLLKNELKEIKRINLEKNQTIDKLKDELQIVKLAKSIDSEEGSSDAKLKINELVREIDKCIGLLNQ
jgi:hypothetical protein